MKHDHSGNSIDSSKRYKIYFAFLITFGFAFVEYTTGKIYNSLALLADAGHMFTDSVGLFIAAIAMYLGSRAANNRHTYGISKIEVAAAIINIFLVCFIVVDILYETYGRFENSVTIDGAGILGVATLGLIINIIVFTLLHYGHENLNTKAAKLHVLGDIFGSIAAIFSGLMIYFFNMAIFDPIFSLIICIVLVKMVVGLTKEVYYVLLDAVPNDISVDKIKEEILNIDECFIGIHDIHIWKSSSTEISLTAHLDVTTLDNWTCLIYQINEILSKHGIEHVTVQPEEKDFVCK